MAEIDIHEIDIQLIDAARRLTTAANVHKVRTLMFAYRFSQSDSDQRKYYEEQLRSFIVNTRRHKRAMHQAG